MVNIQKKIASLFKKSKNKTKKLMQKYLLLFKILLYCLFY